MSAFIPSLRLSKWLEESTVGVFADRISDGSVALVAKLPASVIKAVHEGARIDLLGAVVAVERLKIPLVAIQVHDEPEGPFIAFRGFIREDEGPILGAAIEANPRRLHCFDELSRHVLSCDITVDGCAAALLRRRIEDVGGFIAIDEASHERALDVAEHRIKSTGCHDDNEYLVWDTVPIAVARSEVAEYYGVSTTLTVGPIRLDALDEGGLFEETVHELADEVYSDRAFRSPLGRLGDKERELIDVLLVADDHLILIEAKALSRSASMSGGRRGANLAKDIKKAFRQIVGAARYARLGSVATSDGEPIEIAAGAADSILAIVVVSEMHQGPDWRGIASLIREVAHKHRVLINVVDLTELSAIRQLLQSPYELAPMLAFRFTKVLEKGTAFGRVRVQRGG